jgi:hypothetical protein
VPEDNRLRINAAPTKDFFISMLVKDIELIRAIIDLVDNSVDGARRIRPQENYSGLFVRITATGKEFKITDNCGGIPVDLARNYAFRFGRPEGMTAIPHSVGQFGVGMKRAFFKLGKAFTVESRTTNSKFVVSENVDEWKKREEWEFRFKELKEGLRIPLSRTGTMITIAPLHPGISEEFDLDTFESRLAAELAIAHELVMMKGLEINLGQLPVQWRPLELLRSNQLKPAHEVMSWGKGYSKVTVKIYAGISESSPRDAGWYIFCNGRMVVGADQSLTTGWGEGDGRVIPKPHPQFARFRGYVFFDSDDASGLPWNTTKSGVDVDSPTFKSVRLKMITLMRPVIDFLNRLDREKGREAADPKPLEAAMNAAKPVGLESLKPSPLFVSPKPPPLPRPPATGRIQYSKHLDEIKRVQKQLKVQTYKEVGEKTFEYFLKMECES